MANCDDFTTKKWLAHYCFKSSLATHHTNTCLLWHNMATHRQVWPIADHMVALFVTLQPCDRSLGFTSPSE